MNNIPKGYKLVPVEAHVEKGFDVIGGKHIPTIKIMLPSCHPDDSKAWDRRDAIGSMVVAMLYAAPTPPQPIYDEAKERELFEAHYRDQFEAETGRELSDEDIKSLRDGPLYGQSRTYLNGQWVGWQACAQSRAKAGEDE